MEIYENPNFIIIQSLCNNSKHFKDDDIAKKSEIRNGFILDMNRLDCDSFNQKNYLVDGKDLKIIIEEVFKIYNEYYEDKN